MSTGSLGQGSLDLAAASITISFQLTWIQVKTHWVQESVLKLALKAVSLSLLKTFLSRTSKVRDKQVQRKGKDQDRRVHNKCKVRGGVGEVADSCAAQVKGVVPSVFLMQSEPRCSPRR